jgi:hypothetical protein
MNQQTFAPFGTPLSRTEMKQIKGGTLPVGCNVFTTDTMTPNASMTYMTLGAAQSACWSDPGCVGIDVTNTCL